ncbi:MAG: glycosyltransferase family 4 protein [Oscillospiraceae bacterium]|nr:glycosyltransferase family 4 protein [Oscillospiraceae bacterium]
MKILVITNHSYMLYRFRLELLQELRKTHEVILSMPFVGHEEDFKAAGFRCIETDVDRRGINPKTDIALMKRYRRMLEEERPDMVITYSIKPNIYAGMACSKLGIPFYANVQGLGTAFQKCGISQLVTMLYRHAFRKVSKVFFENEANAQLFQDRKILTRDRQVIVHGAGINLNRYPFHPYPCNDVPHFLYLGRIMKEKGIDELLYAVDTLEKEGLPFHLDLVGFFEDSYKEQFDVLVAKGIATFHGFQETPMPYYVNADCVVLPSYHEGMSNVLLEAAAIGRPVITSDIPGCKEAVDPDVSGYLVPAQDPQALYRAMKQFLTLPRDIRAAMGQAGRTKMEQEFRKEDIIAHTIDALELS